MERSPSALVATGNRAANSRTTAAPTSAEQPGSHSHQKADAPAKKRSSAAVDIALQSSKRKSGEALTAQTLAELAKFDGESETARERRLKKRKSDQIAEKKRRKAVGKSAPISDLELASRAAKCYATTRQLGGGATG